MGSTRQVREAGVRKHPEPTTHMHGIARNLIKRLGEKFF